MDSTIGTTPVIVVTEEKKRRRGFLWVAGGTAALLVGGSTFALWSANDVFGGGTITAGDLNLVKTADTAFYDVSADRTDATTTVPGTDGSQLGHEISSIDDWRIVPGDKVAAAFSSDVTLEGDNLVGKLSIAGLADMVANNTSMTYTYEVYQDGQAIVSESDLPTDGTLLYLSAPGTGQAAGLEDAVIASGTAVDGATAATGVFPMSAVTEDFTIVIYGAFDVTAGDAGTADVDADGVYTDQSTGATGTRTDATVVDTLAVMKLQLDQVRDTGAIFS